MSKKFRSLLSIILVPQIVELIVDKEGIDELVALNELYGSRTYELLAREETNMWHYSPLTIYSIWKSEKETGEMILPEG
ncbi:MAG: hypothetical protein IKC38_05345 [Clostridia bacterium]|nr:hypothetical protein [Clostridia bacterium]